MSPIRRVLSCRTWSPSVPSRAQQRRLWGGQFGLILLRWRSPVSKVLATSGPCDTQKSAAPRSRPRGRAMGRAGRCGGGRLAPPPGGHERGMSGRHSAWMVTARTGTFQEPQSTRSSRGPHGTRTARPVSARTIPGVLQNDGERHPRVVHRLLSAPAVGLPDEHGRRGRASDRGLDSPQTLTPRTHRAEPQIARRAETARVDLAAVLDLVQRLLLVVSAGDEHPTGHCAQEEEDEPGDDDWFPPLQLLPVHGSLLSGGWCSRWMTRQGGRLPQRAGRVHPPIWFAIWL